MARIVLGIGTSHSAILALPAELWSEYAVADRTNKELVFPPAGWVIPFDEAVAEHVPAEIRDRPITEEVFREQVTACTAAIETLAQTWQQASPDITIVVSDDQDEWFYEDNMPSLAVYWGEQVSVVPRQGGNPRRSAEVNRLVAEGYGDKHLSVPVPASFGRHVIESLVEQDFDVAHISHTKSTYGGKAVHRYPTETGELALPREFPEREQGLPHGFSFVVKRLFHNNPGPVLPIVQNTCYPPNAVTPRRCYQFGEALRRCILSWEEDVRVAVIASGGLSHFVVDEELDRTILDALSRKDADALRSLPRDRLRSGTSESLNWVTVGGVLAAEPLQMELVDYVPCYRTEAGTGGGWAFARWC